MLLVLFFFFNDTATSVIYTLSLHDALPISFQQFALVGHERGPGARWAGLAGYQIVASGFPQHARDRKSTRLNSSHMSISYAVFCLKKKTKTHTTPHAPPSNITAMKPYPNDI